MRRPTALRPLPAVRLHEWQSIDTAPLGLPNGTMAVLRLADGTEIKAQWRMQDCLRAWYPQADEPRQNRIALWEAREWMPLIVPTGRPEARRDRAYGPEW